MGGELHAARAEVVRPRFSSVVVPAWMHTVAPSSSLALFTTQLLVHQEALAIVVGHGGKHQAHAAIAGAGPGSVARQDVDLAGLQRGEALLAVRGVKRTLEASPNTAAATARQTSTSIPLYSPLEIGEEKPAGHR